MTKAVTPTVGIIVTDITPRIESILLTHALVGLGIKAFGPFTVRTILAKDFPDKGLWPIPNVLKITPDHVCILVNATVGAAYAITLEDICQRLHNYNLETTFTIVWRSSLYDGEKVFDCLLQTPLGRQGRVRLVDLDELVSKNLPWPEFAQAFI